MRPRFVRICNSDNVGIIRHLLRIRLDRRRRPTNVASRAQYGDPDPEAGLSDSEYACEYAREVGAIVCAREEIVIDKEVARMIVSKTRGLGQAVLEDLYSALDMEEEEDVHIDSV
jgi:hypothetical protein